MKATYFLSTLAAAVSFSTLALAQGAAGFATSDVNLRAGPGTDYPVVTTVAANQAVVIHGCLTGWSWCDVSKGETRGWVAGDFLSAEVQGQRLAFPQVAVQVQAPVVTYDTAAYWDTYYRGQPFYDQRDRWAQVQAGNTAGGAVAGAVAGALIGGPVGAVIGGIAGATIGAGVTPPTEVRSFVVAQQVTPSTITGSISIGAAIPPTVTLYPVPNYQYQFAFVNGQRVLVDPANRQIVAVVQ